VKPRAEATTPMLDGSARGCTFLDPSATSARYAAAERALVAGVEPDGFFLGLAGLPLSRSPSPRLAMSAPLR